MSTLIAVCSFELHDFAQFLSSPLENEKTEPIEAVKYSAANVANLFVALRILLVERRLYATASPLFFISSA